MLNANTRLDDRKESFEIQRSTHTGSAVGRSEEDELLNVLSLYSIH